MVGSRDENGERQNGKKESKTEKSWAQEGLKQIKNHIQEVPRAIEKFVYTQGKWGGGKGEEEPKALLTSLLNMYKQQLMFLKFCSP